METSKLKDWHKYLIAMTTGAVLATTFMYFHNRTEIDTNYVKIHKTNIGGFIFQQGKIYNLVELKNI